MSTTSQSLATLGDSLRELATLVDRVPTLLDETDYPMVPFPVLVGVKSSLALELFAQQFGVATNTTVHGNDVHTRFEVDAGRVRLSVYNIEPLPRELRRPTTTTTVLDQMDGGK